MSKSDDERIITHPFPVRRDLSNFIIFADISSDDPNEEWEWEQLWARERAENLFELCCIPFFAYGLSLGDIVQTQLSGGKRFVIQEVVKASESLTYRIFFRDTTKWDELVSRLKDLRFIVEIRWDRCNLVGVDVAIDQKKRFEEYLLPFVNSGKIMCELSNE